jgi:hypothetical protein
MTPALGSIVWATVPDKNGFKKDRPLVVISIGDEPDPTIGCACITTKDSDPRPATYVRVPWDRRGTSLSGLKEPSFAVADWLVLIHQSEIRAHGGKLSEKTLAQLTNKIESL